MLLSASANDDAEKLLAMTMTLAPVACRAAADTLTAAGPSCEGDPSMAMTSVSLPRPGARILLVTKSNVTEVAVARRGT